MEDKRKKTGGSGTSEEDYRFMKEKIKKKPLNGKKLVRKLAVTLGLGVVFGVTAAFVMEAVRPAFTRIFHKNEEPSKNLSLQMEGELQNESDSKPGAENSQESQPPAEEEGANLLSDFEKLESDIYRIAGEADPFLVDVIGIREEMDWFEEINETESQAPGIIISVENGMLILTERNALKAATSIYVSFCNGEIVQGEEISYDIPTNLSVVHVDLAALSEETRQAVRVASFTDSETIAASDLVLAVGEPLGNFDGVVYGHIAEQTTIKKTDALYGLLFTDMVGSAEGKGVLIDKNGNVLGIINQKFATEGGANLLTALRIDEIKDVIEKLMNGENPGYLGLEGIAVTPDTPDLTYSGEGIYVTQVKKDFPAMQAGIQSGDIITKINGAKVTSMAAFRSEILKYKIGDSVKVTLERLGKGEYKPIEFEITLGGY